MVPLASRNKLYGLFLSCLSDPGAASGFDGLTGDPGYLKDRIPRYRAVLREYEGGGPLALYDLLFEHGLYFDAHEYLEAAWKAAEGPEKLRLQGLIQVAAGFHKLELDPGAVKGARELVDKGLEKLRETDPGRHAKLALKLIS